MAKCTIERYVDVDTVIIEVNEVEHEMETREVYINDCPPYNSLKNELDFMQRNLD